MTAEQAWNKHVRENNWLTSCPVGLYKQYYKYFMLGWEARKSEEIRRAYTPQMELKLR